MFKTKISRILRNSGLLILSDKLHFAYQLIKNRNKNLLFEREYPLFALPPAYTLYESYLMDHSKYYHDGLNTAKWLTEHLSRFTELKNIKILDWGCGPGRIVRHLPDILDKSCEVYGTDYNKTTIQWCRNNLKGIHFSKNELSPPLNFNDEEFDIIYGISIFTHLSEEMHLAWINEFSRILKKGGILFLTSQGDVFINKLSNKEKEAFNTGKLVVRGKTKEGHRTYSAFQSEAFMNELFRDFEILDHIKGEIANHKAQQDVWIVKRSD
jgi:ubiquinone/menaquinone biosynthesis C-methylase UbiE